MDPSPEPAGTREHGRALGPLRGLRELSRLSRDRPSIPELLDGVARTVSEVLGFATVTVNTYHSETDDYEVVAVCGNPRARETLLGQITTADHWEPMVDPRFLHGGAYFVPEGALEARPDP